LDFKLDGDFATFDGDAQEALVADLASVLGVDPARVSLGPCAAGSILAKVFISPSGGEAGSDASMELTALQAGVEEAMVGHELAGYPCLSVASVVEEPQASLAAEQSVRRGKWGRRAGEVKSKLPWYGAGAVGVLDKQMHDMEACRKHGLLPPPTCVAP